MSDTAEPSHLAAGKIPLAVFVATQAALEAGASVNVFITGDHAAGGRVGWRGNTVRAHVSMHARPDAVAALKAAGFRWAGNQWKWVEGPR